MKDIFLSRKEAGRVAVVEAIQSGEKTVSRGARQIHVSERQMYRILARVMDQGIGGLVHGNRSHRPANATDPEIIARVVTEATGAFAGASYAHLSELLAEHFEIELSAKTVGRILRRAGIKNSHTHRSPRRFRRRERRRHRGELVQMDASRHLWIGSLGKMVVLHGAIDDATGELLGLHFREQEDTLGYFEVMDQMLSVHGIPEAIYADQHAIFKATHPNAVTVDEQLQGKAKARTQFGKSLELLGVEYIAARTPQAKGRVERLWGTLQERLAIEMRVAGIASIEAANAFLHDFIKKFNRRFSVQAASSESYFEESPSIQEKNIILAFRHDRKILNGSVFSFDGKIYSLLDSKKERMALHPGTALQVIIDRKNQMFAVLDGKKHRITEFHGGTQKPISVPPNPKGERRPQNIPAKPGDSHPWRQPFLESQRRRQAIRAAQEASIEGSQ